MALIVVAAHLEVAGLLWRPDSHAARRILSKNEQGAQAMLHKVRPHVQDFPKLRGWVDDALVKIRAVLSNEVPKEDVDRKLRESARLVAY